MCRSCFRSLFSPCERLFPHGARTHELQCQSGGELGLEEKKRRVGDLKRPVGEELISIAMLLQNVYVFTNSLNVVLDEALKLVDEW